MHYNDDRYFEPSLADDILSEYTEKMKSALTDNFKTMLTELQETNKLLLARNAELEITIAKQRSELGAINRDKNEIQQQVRKERLSELMKDFEVVMYQVHNQGKKHHKCDKCNEKRQIEFLSPSGKQMSESCSCDKAYTHYVPEEFVCSEFNLRDEFRAWYKRKMYDNKEYYVLDTSTFAAAVYSDGMDYAQIDKYSTFFRTKQECQEYCEWLNSQVAVNKS